MRKGQQGGTCGRCGKSSPYGLYWVNHLAVLDFGVSTMPPIEPDTRMPCLCDDCQELAGMADAYRHDMLSVYGPLTCQEFQRLLDYLKESDESGRGW